MGKKQIINMPNKINSCSKIYVTVAIGGGTRFELIKQLIFIWPEHLIKKANKAL